MPTGPEPSPEAERFELVEARHAAIVEGLAEDVKRGLTSNPKSLSCRYIYDARGSSLFDDICALPEYYPTRSEDEILARRAETIASMMPEDSLLVELGAGSSTKTRHLIEAFLVRSDALLYLPLDISRAALESAGPQLINEYPGLSVRALVGEYARGLEWLSKNEQRDKLVLWLGSNIGNLDRPTALQFLRKVRSTLVGRDRFLVGIDLRKDGETLEAAYDDASGVTERFNKNILRRINRELGGNFDLDSFRYDAQYRETEGRVVMQLISQVAQTVRIESLDLDIRFQAGEAIHTEDSYKYSLAEIDTLADEAGFSVKARWTDDLGYFSLNLLEPTGIKRWQPKG
ncbi:MAG: L-histidine N(alpha)-methyltransferase [Planctomycetes bacterium]|nr:L-histidine N(alpha)-methyltransferase [Planctomycetota bacterium]